VIIGSKSIAAWIQLNEKPFERSANLAIEYRPTGPSTNLLIVEIVQSRRYKPGRFPTWAAA